MAWNGVLIYQPKVSLKLELLPPVQNCLNLSPNPEIFDFLSSPGDILENLRVRVSDPWGKSAPRKNFKILFWLETSIRLQKGVLLKMLFYCQNCTFISRSALLFSGIVLLFFRSASLFLKNVLLFSRISL